jgi:hypothetical protein
MPNYVAATPGHLPKLGTGAMPRLAIIFLAAVLATACQRNSGGGTKNATEEEKAVADGPGSLAVNPTSIHRSER